MARGNWTLGVALAGLALAATPASAALRLAAPADCMANAGCGLGLRDVYGRDVSASLVPLANADGGLQALDSGAAEVAISFSTTPEITREDFLRLRDDRRMIRSDRVVPVVRAAAATRGGRRFVRALDAISSGLTTAQLRGLNASLELGRVPEAVAGEFAQANGLREIKPRRGRGSFVVGHTVLAESEVLAEAYAAALRSAGFRARVRAVKGLRPEAIAALRNGTIDLYPGYSRSLTGYLSKKVVTASNVSALLRQQLRPLGLRNLAAAPASSQNVFVVKRVVAEQHGLRTISDLAAQWPAIP